MLDVGKMNEKKQCDMSEISQVGFLLRVYLLWLISWNMMYFYFSIIYHLFRSSKKQLIVKVSITKRAANLGCCRLRLDPLIIGSSRLNYLCVNSSTTLGISIGWTKTLIQSSSWFDQVNSSQKRVCSCLFCEFSLLKVSIFEGFWLSSRSKRDRKNALKSPPKKGKYSSLKYPNYDPKNPR